MELPLKQGPDSVRLGELAALELRCCAYAQACKGTAAEINATLNKEGILHQYRQIFEEYVALSSFKKARVIRNEALKRALFLSWYCEVEPASFTGLADLPDDKIEDMFVVLSKVLDKGWMNEELEIMLRHYMQWDWIILQHIENKFHPLTHWVKALRISEAQQATRELLLEHTHGRGLMGLYFQELKN